LLAPADGAVYEAPGTVALRVSATDADGSVSKVEFYVNNALLGAVTAHPFSADWTNVAPGTYSVTAKAYDNMGAVTSSSARTISVRAPDPANPAPSVTLVSPVNGSSYPAPAALDLSASAADSGGLIKRVEYFANGALQCVGSAAPWSCPLSNVPAGTWTVTARAVDGLGKAATSASVTVTVTGPQVLYLYNDHLSTPRIATDATGAIVWRRDQADPFGAALPEEDPDGNGMPTVIDLRFPGQYFDAETGLNYNYYRDCDPQTGRYGLIPPCNPMGSPWMYDFASAGVDALHVTFHPTLHPRPPYCGLSYDPLQHAFLPKLDIKWVRECRPPPMEWSRFGRIRNPESGTWYGEAALHPFPELRLYQLRFCLRVVLQHDVGRPPWAVGPSASWFRRRRSVAAEATVRSVACRLTAMATRMDDQARW
jgi:RHS repeat-associated protein